MDGSVEFLLAVAMWIFIGVVYYTAKRSYKKKIENVIKMTDRLIHDTEGDQDNE